MSAENININLGEDSNYSNDDLESIVENLDNYQEYNDMLSDLDDEGITINIISSDEEGSGIRAGRDENDPTQWNITVDKEYGRSYKNQYLGDDDEYHDISDERALLHEIFHVVQIEVLDFPYPTPSTPISYLETLENEAVKHTNDIMEGHGEERRVEDYFNPKTHKQVPLTDISVPSINPEDTPQWMQDLLDDWGVAKDTVSPLVLDLDGQGIDLASVLGSDGVYWDIDEDGFAEKSGWISGNDGLLAIDLNSDGVINNHGELFGTDTTDGFTVLSAYDSNSDNVINVSDVQFDDLLVWVDANSDGYSQSGELFSLTDLGITSINLNASLVDYDIAGNHVTHESTFTINGQTQTIVDAWFAYDNTNSRYLSDYTIDARVMFLPTLRGFGDVKDLHIAMSMDETLLLMVQEIANSGETLLFDPMFDLNGKMEAILYRWAGVDGIDPASRGTYIDARQLEFLENYIGDDYIQVDGSNPNPVTTAAIFLSDMFYDLSGQLLSQILVQGNASVFYGDNAFYNFASGEIENSDLDIVNTLYANQLAFESSEDNDAYMVSEETGNIVINEQGGDDAVWISGALESEIRLENYTSSNDLKIHIGTSSITINDHFRSDADNNNAYDYAQVEKIILDDGSEIDLINNITFTGTSGNDTISGLLGDDTLVGGTGNDTLYGGEGNDVYVYNLGDGNDSIYETGGLDQLVLHGVDIADVRLEKVSSVHLKVHVGSGSILINQQFRGEIYEDNTSGYYEIEKLVLDDGSEIDLINNLIFTGTSGNDTISGLLGDDTLVGGTGNDILYGGEGNDTYVYELGDGNDVIYETSGYDVISFGAGIALTDLTFTRLGNTLTISISGGGTIQIPNYYLEGSSYVIEGLRFDDSSTENLQILVNTAPIALDDTFIGDQDLAFSGNVLIDNAGGVDSDPEGNSLSVTAGTYATSHGSVVVSGNGDFTYTPTAGYNGADSFTYTIDDGFGGTDTASVNITVRPPNIAPIAQDDAFTGDQDVALTGNVLSDNGNGSDSDPDSNPLTVIAGTYATTNGSVVLAANGSFTYTPNAGYVGSDSFTYTLQDDRGGSDIGTANITLSALAVNPNAINGTSANDTLNGDLSGTSNDTLIGYGGDDTLNGKLGNDNYVWTVGDGNDTISETGGVDQLVLHGVVASDIRLEIYNSYNLRVHVGSEHITINSQLYSDAFGGSSYDSYQVESILLDDGLAIDLVSNLTFAGTSGNDTINGMNAATTFIGEEGDDTLNGKVNGDTYIWSVGDGNDTITETGGVDQLVLHGVIASDIRFEIYNSYNLRIHIGSEHITINNQLYSDVFGGSSYDVKQVESILLDDGSTVDLLNNLTFVGTSANDTINGMNADDALLGLAGNDTLNANSGNDTLTGGAGDDTLNGGEGNDSYVWSVGDGNDTIAELGGVDQLVLHGAIASDIRFEIYNSYNLRVHIGSEHITLNSQFYEDAFNSSSYAVNQVENILLDDGSTIDLVNNLTFSGTSGNDTISGLNAATTFIGEAGDDTLNGKANGDTYIWSVGDGNDILTETGGVDQIVLHGVIASDISFEVYSSYNLRIHIGSEHITVNSQFYEDAFNSTSYETYQVESILLDGGSTIDLLNNLTFTGTSGNDTINGLNADDVLFGLTGDDTLNGSNGNDALYGGGGSDYLYGNAGDDVLYGGAGIDMLYGQAGADTFIFESSSAFTASDNIQDFKVSDGDKLDVSDLLSGYDPLTDAISDFVQITESGSNSYLSVDADGGADNFVQVAYIYNETGLTDEDALETSGNLIAA